MDISAFPPFDRRPRRMRRNFGPLLKMMFQAVEREKENGVKCVQVGAHDGRMADPLFLELVKGAWEAILIEPHPVYFAELQRRHANNAKIQCLNVGVSDEPGTMKLFHINEDVAKGYPRGLRGCASLELERLEAAITSAETRHNLVRVDGDVTATDVSLFRLDAILSDQNWSDVDVIVIDVEGHELKVLNSFDLSAVKPSLLIVECNGANLVEEDEYVAVLQQLDFTVFRMDHDLVALPKDRVAIPLSQMMSWLGMQAFPDATTAEAGED